MLNQEFCVTNTCPRISDDSIWSAVFVKGKNHDFMGIFIEEHLWARSSVNHRGDKMKGNPTRLLHQSVCCRKKRTKEFELKFAAMYFPKFQRGWGDKITTRFLSCRYNKRICSLVSERKLDEIVFAWDVTYTFAFPMHIFQSCCEAGYLSTKGESLGLKDICEYKKFACCWP